MTVTVTGRVVDEHGAALPNLTVEARGDWLLTTEQLARDETNDTGRFTLKVPEIPGVAEAPSSFRIRVLDVTRRPLTKDRELAGTVPSHDLGDVTVQRADLDGLLVTNLTGTAKFVSDGNAVKLLVDGGEAFGRIADDIRAATRSVNITQLFFALPPDFHHAEEMRSHSSSSNFLSGVPQGAGQFCRLRLSLTTPLCLTSHLQCPEAKPR